MLLGPEQLGRGGTIEWSELFLARTGLKLRWWRVVPGGPEGRELRASPWFWSWERNLANRRKSINWGWQRGRSYISAQTRPTTCLDNGTDRLRFPFSLFRRWLGSSIESFCAV